LGPDMPFLDNNICIEGELFICARVFFFMYDAIHGWMTGWTDEWMDGSHDEKSFTKNDHDVLYYM
jgi:hypothetical protein